MAYYYNTEDIIVFPSSNSTDEGKLTLEENISNIVTRITDRNYVLKSDHLAISVNESNITIAPGKANIQGYHVMILSPKTIAVPSEMQSGWICIKLAKDGSGHIRGDVKDGATTRFEGVYITFIDKESDIDELTLVLASFKWNGSNVEVTKNPEVLYKYDSEFMRTIVDLKTIDLDPNRSDTDAIMSIQDYILNIPDWYLSKFGDFITGDLNFDIATYTFSNTNNRGLFENRINCGSLILGKDLQSGLEFKSICPEEIDIFVSVSANKNKLSGILMKSKTDTSTNTVKIGFANGASSEFIIECDLSDMQLNRISFSTNGTNICSTNKIVVSAYNNDNDDNISLDIFNNAFRLKSKISNGYNEHVFGYDITGAYPFYELGILKFMTDSNNDAFIINRENRSISILPGIVTDELVINSSFVVGSLSNNFMIFANNLNNKINDVISNTIGDNGIRSIIEISSVDNIISPTKYTKLVNDTITLFSPSNGTSYIRFNNASGSNVVSLSKKANENTLKLDNGNFEVSGTMKGSRVYNAVYNDVAEWYEKDDLNEVFQPGDVIELNPKTGKYRKTQSLGSMFVVGVVTDTYGIIVGGEDLDDMEENHKKYIPVGIAGRVYVKVPDNAIVYPGQLLTSYCDGYAVPANDLCLGTIIGKALSTNQNGKVLMQIMLI